MPTPLSEPWAASTNALPGFASKHCFRNKMKRFVRVCVFEQNFDARPPKVRMKFVLWQPFGSVAVGTGFGALETEGASRRRRSLLPWASPTLFAAQPKTHTRRAQQMGSLHRFLACSLVLAALQYGSFANTGQ